MTFFTGIENETEKNKNKVRRRLWRSLLCCWSGRGILKGPGGSNGGDGDRQSPPLLTTGSPQYLLPAIRHQDMHKKCMVIDLDETLVHSSFKVIMLIY